MGNENENFPIPDKIGLYGENADDVVLPKGYQEIETPMSRREAVKIIFAMFSGLLVSPKLMKEIELIGDLGSTDDNEFYCRKDPELNKTLENVVKEFSDKKVFDDVEFDKHGITLLNGDKNNLEIYYKYLGNKSEIKAEGSARMIKFESDPNAQYIAICINKPAKIFKEVKNLDIVKFYLSIFDDPLKEHIYFTLPENEEIDCSNAMILIQGDENDNGIQNATHFCVGDTLSPDKTNVNFFPKSHQLTLTLGEFIGTKLAQYFERKIYKYVDPSKSLNIKGVIRDFVKLNVPVMILIRTTKI